MRKSYIISLIVVFVTGFMPVNLTMGQEAEEKQSTIVNKIYPSKRNKPSQLSQISNLSNFSDSNNNFLNKKDSSNKKLNYVPGEVLIKFKNQRVSLESSVGLNRANQFTTIKNLEKKDEIKKGNIGIYKIKGSKTVEETVGELQGEPDVEYAEPNYIHPWASTPNDSYYNQLWGMDKINNTGINAVDAWDIATGSDSVIVGVLDSGIAYNHPDLINNMWNDIGNCRNEDNIPVSCPYHGWDFTNEDNNPLDESGHGTHVAGTIGAEGNNNKGVAGVNWNVKLMALKVGNYQGAISGDVANAIDFAINNGVKVLNASFGGYSYSLSEYEAIQRFQAAGGIFVAAAGNEGFNSDLFPAYPCSYDLDNIICVAATDSNKNLWPYSNYGVSNVDVAAPGVDIYSTLMDALNETFDELSPPNIPNGWTKTGNWGTFNFGGNNNVLYGDINYPYANNANTSITTSRIDLSMNSSANISFHTQCDNSYNFNSDGSIFTDYMTMEISNDGSSFAEVFRWDELYLDVMNKYPYNSFGSSAYDFFIEIPDYYLTNNFQIRFNWITDGVDNNYDGCFINNLKIVPDGENNPNGTEMNEDFDSVTAPNIPNGWSKTGNWGTYYIGGFWGNVLYGDINYPYANNVNSTITTNSIDIYDRKSAIIYFHTQCDNSYNFNSDGPIFTDYITLEISKDGNNFTEFLRWDELYLDILNNNPYNSSGASSYNFIKEIPHDYRTSNFTMRFRWVTDGVDNYYDGCFIEDLIVITESSDEEDGVNEQYGWKQGTSMATPHVAGLSALIWGYKPELTTAEVKDVILTTGDDLSSLVGKTVTGKRINAFNALQSLTPEGHTISGTVLYYDGVKPVPDANVILEDDQGVQLIATTTDANGYYEFTGLESGNNYVVRVERNDGFDTNGVNVTDLIKTKKHTLLTEVLDSIYKIIAGDVNDSGTINVTDLIKIKKYTLLLEALPSASWKFYSSDAILTEGNYLSEGLTREYTNLTSDMTNQNFTGIKMGDVNNSWTN